MGKKQEKKRLSESKSEKKYKGSLLSKQRLKSAWADRNPVLLFILVFGALMGVFYAVWMTEFFKENIFYPALYINAKIASLILNIFGYDTAVLGVEVSNSDFTMAVKRGCDGLEPTALFVSAVLAFPESLNTKLRGIILGSLFLLTINLIRVISLFITGVHFPNLFEILHIEVWQVIFIILAVACWVVWFQWTNKAKQPTRHV